MSESDAMFRLWLESSLDCLSVLVREDTARSHVLAMQCCQSRKAAAAIFSSDVDICSISAVSITHLPAKALCLNLPEICKLAVLHMFVYFPLCHRKKLKADGNRILLTIISYLSVSKSAKAKKNVCLRLPNQP